MDKIILITGASSDMGGDLIRKVYGGYSRIWAHYNTSADELERLQSEIGNKVYPIQCDFSSLDSIQQMIQRIDESGCIPNQIVHFAAPKTFNMQFHKCCWEEYQKGIDTSLKSITILLQHYIPFMRKQKYGRIVFLLTSYLIGVPPKFQSPYITVKYALFGLMRNLAAEYADKGITVNGISPDMVETKFLDKVPSLIIRQNAEKSPIKRNLKPGDVTPAIKYLLSDDAEAVTGVNLGITGGTVSW